MATETRKKLKAEIERLNEELDQLERTSAKRINDLEGRIRLLNKFNETVIQESTQARTELLRAISESRGLSQIQNITNSLTGVFSAIDTMREMNEGRLPIAEKELAVAKGQLETAKELFTILAEKAVRTGE